MSGLWHFLTEDWLGVLINLYFGVALYPTLKDSQKPPLKTSLPTGLGLILLGLGGSFHATAVSIVVIGVGIVWLMIAWQRWQQG